MYAKKLIFALVAIATLVASETSLALKSLLHQFDIETSEPEEIVRETQRLCLRKPGQERWDLPDFSPNDRAGILTDLLETVGPGASENLNIALALDACARTLYVDLEIEKKMRYDPPYEKPRNCPGSAEEHTSRK